MKLIPWGGVLALLVLTSCGPQDRQNTAKAPEEEETVNLLARDPGQGFTDFQAVGTDGLTAPDCCKVPLPDPKTAESKT